MAARIVLQAVGGGAGAVASGAAAGAGGFVSWGEVVDMVGEVECMWVRGGWKKARDEEIGHEVN